ERRGVVVALAGPLQAVLRDQVPLLAGNLARLAADADGGVGEEAHTRLCFDRISDPHGGAGTRARCRRNARADPGTSSGYGGGANGSGAAKRRRTLPVIRETLLA